MRFLGREILLAIFDFDGTLLDSTSLWAKIDQRFFAKRGQDVPPHYGEEAVHLGLEKAAEWTKEAFFPNEEAKDILAEWRSMALEAYRNELILKPCAKEVLSLFKNNGMKLALATANSKDLYQPCIDRLQIGPLFDFVVDVFSVKEGKKSSRIYDLTAEHFGVKKENVVIFEDALEPMMTAYRAGYLTVGVYDSNTTKDEAAARKSCDLFVNDFAALLEKIS